jgi:hypothetical protein
LIAIVTWYRLRTGAESKPEKIAELVEKAS